MGYLFMCIALLMGAIKGYCGKKTSGLMKQTADAATINTVRMAICSLVGLILVSFSGLSSLAVPTSVFWVCVASGVCAAMFPLTWILAVSRGAYMLVEVFLTVSVMIPVLFCRIAYNEELNWRHLVGFVILVVAVYIMCSYNNQVSNKLTLPGFLLLIACMLANGCVSLTQKIYIHQNSGVSAEVFNFYTFMFAFLTLLAARLIFFLIDRKKRKNGIDAPKEKLQLKTAAVYIVILAVCLFGYSFMQTKAAALLPSILLYPLMQVSGMLISTFMSAALYKERITKRGALGIALALAGILVINLPWDVIFAR